MSRKPATWPAALAFLIIAAVLGFSLAGGQLQALAAGAKSVTGSSYELHTVKSQSGQDLVSRWNPCQKAITWKINLAGVPAAKKAAVTAEVKKGFSTLAGATGMTYRFEGKTGFVPTQENLTKMPAEIVVAAVNWNQTDLDTDESTLGFGGTVSATWTHNGHEGAAVVRGYVVLDPKSFLGLKAGFGTGNTQGNVIEHELGHATGLEHPGSSAEIMYSTLTDNSPAGYQAGDLTALAKQGKASGCIAIPAGVGLADLN